jgi:hypothetical protein
MPVMPRVLGEGPQGRPLRFVRSNRIARVRVLFSVAGGTGSRPLQRLHQEDARRTPEADLGVGPQYGNVEFET